MTFKDHFSGHADGYRGARPTYPDALFDWLATQAPARDLAWDAGCGNGQAAFALSAHFARVVVTDPSASQIANAETKPNIDYRVELAERGSLADASADLVTVAQALHWFDLDLFYAEVRRVLKPRGLFAAWTYGDCHVDAAVDGVKDRLYVDLTGPYWPPERAHIETGYRDLPFPFIELAVPRFAMRTQWTLEQFLAYLRSWSASQRYLKATGEDPVSLIECDLRGTWGNNGRRDVCWEFHLRCGRS